MFLFPEELGECVESSLHILKNKTHLMLSAIYCYISPPPSCGFSVFSVIPEADGASCMGYPLIGSYSIRIYESDITNCLNLLGTVAVICPPKFVD